MPKVLPAIFSYEDMKSRFAEDNPDDPYTRRADLESGIYELDKWLIRVDDDNKAISTVGFKEHPSHTVVGGMYATEYGESLGGNSRALQDAREPQLNQSKPLVAAFGHRRGDNARWIANAKKNGWSFPDSPNWEQMSQLLPQDVLNSWLSKYPERMAIRSIRGEGEFAKCVYLDDPTPSWFNVLKSEKRGWRDIIKVLPPSPPFMDYPNYPEADNSHVNFPPQIYFMDDVAVIVRSHYLMRVNGTLHGTRDRNTDEIERWIECVKDYPVGKYYMYRSPSPHDYQTILVDIISQGMKFPNSAPEKFLSEGLKNPENGKVIQKVIIFTNYFNRSKDKPKRKFIPCNGAKEEKKHPAQRKREKIKERQEFNPFDPAQAAAKRKKLAEENRRRGNRRYRR